VPLTLSAVPILQKDLLRTHSNTMNLDSLRKTLFTAKLYKRQSSILNTEQV